MKLRPWSRHRLTSLQKFLRFWSFRKPWFVFQSGHRKNGRCRPSQYEGRSNVRHNYGGPRANVPLLESTGRIRGQGSEVTFPTSHTLQAGNWRIKEERKSSDLKAAHGIDETALICTGSKRFLCFWQSIFYKYLLFPVSQCCFCWGGGSSSFWPILPFRQNLHFTTSLHGT